MNRNQNWGMVDKLMERGLRPDLPAEVNAKIQTLFWQSQRAQSSRVAAQTAYDYWVSVQRVRVLVGACPPEGTPLTRALEKNRDQANKFYYFILAMTPRNTDPFAESLLSNKRLLARGTPATYDQRYAESVLGAIPSARRRELVEQGPQPNVIERACGGPAIPIIWYRHEGKGQGRGRGNGRGRGRGNGRGRGAH